jgi:hypothetical protein
MLANPIQPNVITPDERAGVQTGELMLVTDSGCESLHRYPRGFSRIGGYPSSAAQRRLSES